MHYFLPQDASDGISIILVANFFDGGLLIYIYTILDLEIARDLKISRISVGSPPIVDETIQSETEK